MLENVQSLTLQPRQMRHVKTPLRLASKYFALTSGGWKTLLVLSENG